jgi:putative heme iron utilization protein
VVKKVTSAQCVQEIRQFKQQQKSLLLASQSANGESLASYAPFIESDDGIFYLLLSDLAQHSVNLKCHLKESRDVSILLIEDESLSRNYFARKRLSYSCSVSMLLRTEPAWADIMNLFKAKFDKTVDVLSTLPDFNLYVLNPLKGQYIRGFGQAYELGCNVKLSLIEPSV